MKPLPKSLYVKARIWRLVFPIRWVLSTWLWLFSWAARLLSWIFLGMHVAIDYIRLMALDYTARPDDVFIVTYPRSGTTWLQMILYQLTTDGNMDFGHIAEVCPWFERTAISKFNLDALPSPRVFKSHLPHIWIPKRLCRYIYVARNGQDVAVSFYHFYKSHFRYKGTFSDFDKLFMRGWVAWGSWFYHVSGYWKHRNDPNMLFLYYEDMVRDLEGAVRKIIDFLELKIPEERIPEILHRCSFAFMKEHESKFDYATECLLDQGVTPGTFIRKGKVGEGETYFNEEERERFQKKYERSLGRLGVSFDAKPAEQPKESPSPSA
jgi:hypothetical protein